MTDKDRGAKPQPNETLPADEDLEEEPEDFVEADEEFEEEPQAAAAAPAASRARGAAEARKSLGSLRGTHERVHVDDRLSAIFALVAAVLLLGVLLLPFLGGFVPAPAQPKLTPLVVPTYNATPAPAATATVAPTTTPAATPTK